MAGPNNPLPQGIPEPNRTTLDPNGYQGKTLLDRTRALPEAFRNPSVPPAPLTEAQGVRMLQQSQFDGPNARAAVPTVVHPRPLPTILHSGGATTGGNFNLLPNDTQISSRVVTQAPPTAIPYATAAPPPAPGFTTLQKINIVALATVAGLETGKAIGRGYASLFDVTPKPAPTPRTYEQIIRRSPLASDVQFIFGKGTQFQVLQLQGPVNVGSRNRVLGVSGGPPTAEEIRQQNNYYFETNQRAIELAHTRIGHAKQVDTIQNFIDLLTGKKAMDHLEQARSHMIGMLDWTDP